MTHQEALANTSEKSTCTGTLIDGADSFSSDIHWSVFTCEECLKTVFTVEGYAHWWNHDEGQPSSTRLAQQEKYRASRVTV